MSPPRNPAALDALSLSTACLLIDGVAAGTAARRDALGARTVDSSRPSSPAQIRKKNQMQRVLWKTRKPSSDPPTPDLSSFQIAAKISNQRRGLGGSSSKPSQQSLATNSSFATANEIVTPAASYFVDSSDEETNAESLKYPADPLDRILAQTESESTPTEIFISNLPSDEENMPSKKKSSSKVSAPVPEPVVEPSPVVAAAPAEVKAEVVFESESAHFDVAQTAYGAYKDLWCWGKTLPVISNVLGLTEDVTSKVLSAAVKMDLPSIDEKVAVPHLKKLDDEVVTPAILAVWGVIEPAVGKTDEMIVKPVMTEVVPRILGPLGMFKDDKKDEAVPALN